MPLEPNDAAHIWEIIKAAEVVADDIAGLKLGTCLNAHSP